MTRVSVKVGDVFSVELDNRKRYFQYIANDLTQLNSDVIRIFKKHYSINSDVDISEIISDDIELYVHCIIKLGLKMEVWRKIGYINDVGDIKNIMFREATDYARKVGEEPIKISKKWFVWNINKSFISIGKLGGEYRKAFIGLIIKPKGIIELLKGNAYPPNYPN